MNYAVVNEPIVIEREEPPVTPPFTRIVTTSCVHKSYKLEVMPSERDTKAITFRIYGPHGGQQDRVGMSLSLDNAVEIAREILRYAEAMRDAELEAF